jgi:hypothetical protein
MLPEDWKKEIEEAINQADARDAERDKTYIASQNAIVAHLTVSFISLIVIAPNKRKPKRASAAVNGRDFSEFI